MNKKFTYFFQKKSLAILIASSIFITTSVNAKINNTNTKESTNSLQGLSIGIGFDVSYLAPTAEISYKVNDYLGLRTGFQYTVSDNINNVLSERQIKKDFKNANIDIKRLKYNNFAIPFMIDLYPLKNQIRTSAGIGYMTREFHDKLKNQSIKNPEKIFFIASIGYKDSFGILDNSLGYSIDLKCNIVNKKLRKINKDKWEVDPTVVFAITYDL